MLVLSVVVNYPYRQMLSGCKRHGNERCIEGTTFALFLFIIHQLIYPPVSYFSGIHTIKASRFSLWHTGDGNESVYSACMGSVWFISLWFSKTSVHLLYQLSIYSNPAPETESQLPVRALCRQKSVLCWRKFRIMGSTPERRRYGGKGNKRAEPSTKKSLMYVCMQKGTLCIWMCPALYISLPRSRWEYLKHLTL